MKRRIKNIGFKENGWKSNFAELWGKRFKNAFTSNVTAAKHDPQEYKRLMENSLKHWQGNHEACDHKEKPDYEPLTMEEIQPLEKIFREYINKAFEYIEKRSMNRIESLNSVIAKYAPKRINFSRNYCWRADLAMLEVWFGSVIKIEILQRLGMNLSEPMIERIQKQDAVREVKKKYNRGPEVKKKKAQNKKKKNARTKRGEKEAEKNFTYGKKVNDVEEAGDEEEGEILLPQSNEASNSTEAGKKETIESRKRRQKSSKEKKIESKKSKKSKKRAKSTEEEASNEEEGDDEGKDDEDDSILGQDLLKKGASHRKKVAKKSVEKSDFAPCCSCKNGLC